MGGSETKGFPSRKEVLEKLRGIERSVLGEREGWGRRGWVGDGHRRREGEFRVSSLFEV